MTAIAGHPYVNAGPDEEERMEEGEVEEENGVQEDEPDEEERMEEGEVEEENRVQEDEIEEDVIDERREEEEEGMILFTNASINIYLRFIYYT